MTSPPRSGSTPPSTTTPDDSYGDSDPARPVSVRPGQGPTPTVRASPRDLHQVREQRLSAGMGLDRQRGLGKGPGDRRLPTMAGPRATRGPGPTLSQDPALRRRVQSGGVAYTRNFGHVDGDHMRHNFGSYLDTYAAAERASRTGRPQQVTLNYGDGATRYRMTYTVNPGRGASPEQLHRISRGIVADASHRYEQHTTIGGGLGNRVAQQVGLGSSAFSTEDLPSNGLGMMAAEAHIRRHGNATPADREQAATAGVDYVLDRSGGLADGDPTHQVPVTSFGNRGFTPRRSTAIRAEPGADAYLRRLDRERADGTAGSGPGWRRSGAHASPWSVRG